MTIKEFSSEEEWAKAATDFILQLNPKTVALSGGTTPTPIYKALSEHSTFRDEVDFFLADERYVPPTNENSNYKLIRETLNPKHFYHFDTSLPITEALTKYAQELPESLDLTILGIGEDGHIASIFPHSHALHSNEKVAHTQTENFAIKDRLTLTLQTILNSKNILVLLKNKPEVLTEIKTPTKRAEDCPAHHLKKNVTIYAIT